MAVPLTTFRRYIGERVRIRRDAVTHRHAIWRAAGTLLDVKRSRVLIKFLEQGSWLVPASWVLLPGQVESLPGQLRLFET